MLLASLVALFAFFWQTQACFAEHAGIIPCHEQAGDSRAEEIHVESNAAPGQALLAASLVFREVGYHARDFGAPDGPVEEIDYPPQILS